MSEDVVDFGPPGSRDVTRAPRQWPSWVSSGISLPLAVIGAGLAVASCVGEWQSIHLDASRISSSFGGEALTTTVSGVGPLGTAYLIAVVGSVTLAVLAFFGDEGVRNTARLAGIALAVCGLAMVGAAASMLSDTFDTASFRYVPAAEPEMTLSLEWGVYAAAAAMAALGAALALHQPARPRRPIVHVQDEPEYEVDAVADLTVTVEPMNKPAR